eukprot:CAMPEP_0202695830 /NCGR_PEP_ID=MMETSP1385-20130828/9305_1 /ASSEMBLY_ACC=CAM_ASM_000861 /TAXON_ID=933848 /ORGANISM="Elphidium margaritaceum" /LENGTH=369 /DNA_ID=CAMNT_0049351907 /DNA_START=135 /DNA_END=1244 /DNA_ORIENTATION=+
MSSSASSTTNSKKRTLQELENQDNDEDSVELEAPLPSPAPAKKRKLSTKESALENLNKNDTASKDHDDGDQDTNENKDDESEEEDDDLKTDQKQKQTKETKEAQSASPFKICCYNINGIRAAHKKNLEQYLEEEDADIVCLSEMKATLAQNPCNFRGYQVIWYECVEKKGYSGTAVLSKTKPLQILKGIGCEDMQGRAITLEFERFYLVNTYVPNSGQQLKFKQRRLNWDKAMKKWLTALQLKKPVIWTGDLNVAVLDFDVYDGETNKQRAKSAGFTPYERDNFRKLRDELGLVDAYRHFYPNEREQHYTFFTARQNLKKQNRGWRLDYFMVSKTLINIVDDVQIRRDKECSDHVPLILMMKDPNEALC